MIFKRKYDILKSLNEEGFMKRILIAIMMIMILTGCSSQMNETTYMLTHDELFALYNQDGKRLTNYLYTNYEEIEGVGYIVFDQNNQSFLLENMKH